MAFYERFFRKVINEQVSEQVDAFVKSFNDENILMTGNNVFSTSNDENILIENIYDVIASQLSLLKTKHIVYENGDPVEKKDDLYKVLGLRPNALQNPSEFLYTIFYQVIKYGNALMFPNYDEKTGELIEIEVIDVSRYTFAKGYAKKNNDLYLLLARSDRPAEVVAYHYESLIHIRRNPNALFNLETYKNGQFDRLLTVFDRNIESQLLELAQNNVLKGVLYLKGALGDTENKQKRSLEFEKQLMKQRSGFITLDDGEKLETITQNFKTISAESIDANIKLVYRFFGLNEKILDGNFNDSEYSAFYNKTLEPLIIRFYEELNYKLIGTNRLMDGERLMPQKRLLVGGTLKDVTAAIDKYIYHGVTTANELREELGFIPRAGGDELFTNANAVHISSHLRGGEADEE